MLRTALAFAFLLALSACDSTYPEARLDPLSESFLRVTNEVPSFGGVEYKLRGDDAGDDATEPLVTVYTLGDVAAAEAVAGPLFRRLAVRVEVKSRPAQGRGSEELKNQAGAILLGIPNGGTSADYDERTGYVRIGVRNASAVRRTLEAIRANALPESDIIIQVDLPFRAE